MSESAVQGAGGQVSAGSVYSLIGFKAMLGWHYVVLFSPLLIGSMDQEFFTFFFERQLVLFLSLAASFALFVAAGRFVLGKSKTMFSQALIVALGIVALLATAASMPVVGLPLAWRLVAVGFLGFAEAGLMLFWLHFYMEAVRGHVIRSFVADMITGAIIAVLICCFEAPIGQFVTLCLPVVAGVSLVACWTQAPPLDAQFESKIDKPERRRVVLATAKTLLPTAVYAFSFGALQGAFLESDIALLMANNFIVLVGIILAGVVILLLAHGKRVYVSIDAVHRSSLLMLVLGVVSLSVLTNVQGSGGGGSFSFAR